jgi:PadR family transcriptional regulator PadR
MPNTPPRLTQPVRAVVEALTSAATDHPLYGLQLCAITDLGPGTVYPILERLAKLGWVDSTWETGQPSGRPRRRYYRITDHGRTGWAKASAARKTRRRQ